MSLQYLLLYIGYSILSKKNWILGLCNFSDFSVFEENWRRWGVAVGSSILCRTYISPHQVLVYSSHFYLIALPLQLQDVLRCTSSIQLEIIQFLTISNFTIQHIINATIDSHLNLRLCFPLLAVDPSIALWFFDSGTVGYTRLGMTCIVGASKTLCLKRKPKYKYMAF